MILRSVVSILLALVELLYWIFVYLSRKNPNSNWPKVFITPIGPGTDVAYMSRGELFKSAVRFFAWGMHFTILIIIVSHLMFDVIYKDSEPHMVVIAVACFMIPIACGICYFSSAYLFIRGILRSENYVSPEF
jgi:hypothetical protein